MEGRHELRIAFPPGPRRTGSGKLLEILHPKGERNPECEIAGKNPAELIIFGNPGKGESKIFDTSSVQGLRQAERYKTKLENKYDKVTTVSLGLNRVRIEGRNENAKRNASGGQTAAFAAYNAGVMDAKAGRPPRPQDWEYPESYKKGYARAQTSKKNPRRRSRAATSGRKKNQGDAAETDKAVRVFQTFQGRDPAAIIEKHVSDKMREDYAALGKLDYLLVENCDGEKVKIDFEGDGVLLASSPDATQLYCIGGNQNLEPCLGKFTDDPSKDLLDLGQILEVEYLARKAQGKFEPVKYFHQFGEERRGSELPRAIYDKLRKQVFFAGGEYKIEQPGIIN
jgi:hypothetical protein